MLAPRITELAYSADTLARFAGFAQQPWAILLDSAWPRSLGGRYDIFAAEPYIKLSTYGANTLIETRSAREASAADPFSLIRKYLGDPGPVTPGIPFTGGALGYFAYDLGRRLERLPVIARQDISLPDMAIGIYDWAVVVDHKEQRSWLAGWGRDERTFAEWDRLVARISTSAPPPVLTPFTALAPVQSNFDGESYAKAFYRIKHYIREGDCYQVNLAQRFSAPVAGDPWDAYRRLRALSPAPYAVYFLLPEGAVLSSSPERFLRVTEGNVETKPIKGTRPRSLYESRDRELAEELRNSLKDRAENVMIVDLLRNDLGKNCAIGSVKVPKLFDLESFANVHHLVSTVTGRLVPDRHALDLLAGCFPGGSITGAPKLRAMEIIEELEPHRRSVYCGGIGYIGYDGEMDTNIAIRTLVMNQGRMYAWAGGGIVMDSVMAEEYQETLDKAAAMLRLLSASDVL